jgi:hypothetical protein
MPKPRTPAKAPQFHSLLRDRVLAVIFLVVNAPVMFIVALIIKCNFRGSLLVRRASEENHGLQVAVWEFRTSPIDPNNRKVALSTIIKNTHLATMPRLFNIAYGELPFSALFSEDGAARAKSDRLRIVEQVLPLWAMLERLGYDKRQVGLLECDAKLAKMKYRCATCRNVAACRRWLDGQEPTEAYKKFCPNAEAFTFLPGSLAAQ